MRDLALVLKAVSDRNRLRILKLLQTGPKCVCEIRAVLGISQPSVSRHLNLLKNAGLVADARRDIWTDYHLAKCAGNSYAGRLLKCLESWLEDDPAILVDRRKSKTADRLTICCRK